MSSTEPTDGRSGATGPTPRRSPTADADGNRLLDEFATPRSFALIGLATMTAGYLATLHWLTTVVGGALWLAGGVAIGLGAGVLCRTVDERRMLGVAATGAVLATVLYYATAAPSIGVGSAAQAVLDGLVMLSGVSVLELTAADVWIAALVPVPVFLTTYFGLRGRYVLAAAAGGWLLLFLAVTGDATVPETLLGTVGAFAAVGFGEQDRRGGSVSGANALIVVIVVMAVLAVAVPLVPSGSASALDPGGLGPGDGSGEGGSDAAPTPLDEQLIGGSSITAGGPINLSTDVQFVVESPEKLRWRTGSLGAYDGNSWYRAGSSMPFIGAPNGPPGATQTVEQRYQLRAPATSIPAASYPVEIDGIAPGALQLSSTQTIDAAGQINAGTNYTVESEVPTPDESTLQSAGTDYPQAVERRYTRLPTDTIPDRVYEITNQITADASTPYERARAVEAYLESEKQYSQDVQAPSGTMVDGFLFEMEAGYCTYFAASMATMLRTQGIPTRVAVGYASGQWTGNDTWVVRGTDAHAWVEVYFPDVGWIEFDPTPGGPRDSARSSAIQSARENNASNVDVPESVDEPIRFEPPEDGTGGGTGPSGGDVTGPGGSGQSDAGEGTGLERGRPRFYSGSGANATVAYVQPELGNVSAMEESGGNASGSNGATGSRPAAGVVGDHKAAILAVLLVAGTVAWGRQIGARRRLWRTGSVLWQRRTGPEADAERAMQRLETHLGRRYEPRADGETRREFRDRLPASVDPAVGQAYEIHERVCYAGEVDRATADELVETVDGIVRRDIPGIRRLT
ncbi:hypothetical protein GCM10028857_01830 [Salinarchaeum chitinilyticum]